jgi:hypothetical protein
LQGVPFFVLAPQVAEIVSSDLEADSSFTDSVSGLGD